MLIRDIYDVLALLNFVLFDAAASVRRRTLAHFGSGITHILGEPEAPSSLIKELFAQERHDDTCILPGDLSVIIEIITIHRI